MDKHKHGVPALAKNINRLGVVLVLFLVLATSSAGAQEISRGDENGVVELGLVGSSNSGNVPGASCVASSGNNESVHTGNLLVVEQSGLVVASGEIENAPNDGFDFVFVSNGDPIRYYIQLVDDVTSADVVISCEPPQVTTTTAPEEETTTSSSSTTVPTTPSTVPTTPTTDLTTTVTTPPPTVPTTPTTVNENCPPDGLACTGSETELPVAFGLLFIVLGAIALVATRLVDPT